MSRLRPTSQPLVEVSSIEAYLELRYGCRAVLVGIDELGQRTQASLKDYGYGRPLLVRYALDELEHRLVVRTMSPDPFGHDRRGDRVGALVDDFDRFRRMPAHIQPLDVGTFDSTGRMMPMGSGEGFLVTEYVDGALYADDLHALVGVARAREGDLQRALALADHLVEVHAEPAAPADYARCLRDTVGSGEGIFGLCDSYPADHPVATPARLMAIEQAATRWRWRLRDRAERRARRTHGDFHPFNVLFRQGCDLSVLDCSRGGAGEPADDLTCMSINYAFFALTSGREAFDGALRELWDTFWTRYLERTGDRDVLACVAPFFAWRALVVASPVWYPDVDDAVRHRMLRFAERLLEGVPFAPDAIDDLLAS